MIRIEYGYSVFGLVKNNEIVCIKLFSDNSHIPATHDFGYPLHICPENEYEVVELEIKVLN